VTPQKPRPAGPTLREAKAAGNTSDVDVDQQVLIESACGNSLSDVALLDVSLPDVSLPDVPLRHARMARYARSAPVLTLDRRRWVLRLG